MFSNEQTDVLVVGAGPVGLFTAVRLVECGLQVTIIDEEWRTAAHSYACALHPRSLELLDRLALASPVLEVGRRVETIGFYEGQERRLGLDLTQARREYPCACVLAQSQFEEILEQRLKQQAGLKVRWNHRLADLRLEGDAVVATVEKLAGAAQGYSVPTWEVLVQKRYEVRAAFVVGADGHLSLTRRLLGIHYEQIGSPDTYAVYEFGTKDQFGGELRVVLDAATTNVVWPLPGGKCRWSFQVATSDAPEFPAKERRPVRFCEESTDAVLRADLRRLLADRAPWFSGSIGDFDWTLQVQFGRGRAQPFGQGRCWLVGDAAHQTSPVGMQSMNIGLREAAELAEILRGIVRERGRLDRLQAYDQERQREWQRLLGETDPPRPNPNANPWTRAHAARILPCLPASGEDLDRLLLQAGLEAK